MAEPASSSCATAGCDKPVGPRTESPFCHNCRGVHRYWRRKHPSARVRRREFLAKSQARMEEV